MFTSQPSNTRIYLSNSLQTQICITCDFISGPPQIWQKTWFAWRMGTFDSGEIIQNHLVRSTGKEVRI